MTTVAAFAPLKTSWQVEEPAAEAHQAFECMPGPLVVADSLPFFRDPRAAGWHRRPAHAWPELGTRAGFTATACTWRRSPYLPGVACAVGNHITQGEA